MLALAGAHRSGKTTLARALAAAAKVEFLETKVSGVFANLGIDPKADLPFDQRLFVQNEILRSLEVQYALRKGSVFIADRSPLDVLGYTMAEIRRDTLDDAGRERVYDHVRYATKIIKDNLHGIALVRPLPNQVTGPGKAQACPLYMDHVYVCIQTMASNLGDYCPDLSLDEIPYDDHEDRMAHGAMFVDYVRDRYEPKVQLWTPSS